MPESQNIEWKKSWRDEYLKWICGFANAQGGKIYIGKDDKGNVVGVANTKKLLEDIPNKAKDILGIIVDVNIHSTKDGDYIEICIDGYPYPVNYKGQYHYRTGNTKQELRGAALDKFLLKKKGKRWDGVPIPNVSVGDLKQETFDLFKKRALKSKRIEEGILMDSNELLIENLQLKENDFIKRAAILLFHPMPERFVNGSYIKIGFFKSDSDLMYQDEIHGNIIEQIENTMDLLFTKYIKAEITYEGIHRVETYEYPRDAIREALLNAVIHKDYSGNTAIQISVYKDKIMFWNDGELPENWTVERLSQKHASKPYNPDIANAVFRCGYIESWGRGTLKIIESCVEAGLPKPTYKYEADGLWVIFNKDKYTSEYLKSLNLNIRQIKAILYTKENGRITNSEYQKINDIGKTTATQELTDIVSKGLYKLTGKGRGAKYELN